jgi:hypothetical protein
LFRNIHRKQGKLWWNALPHSYSGAQRSARDSIGPVKAAARLTLTLNIVSDDPRYSPRRSRHARSRYHTRRHGSSLDALSRRDRRVLHDQLFRSQRRAQPPIRAHVVPFFRQKKLRCAVPQGEKRGNNLELKSLQALLRSFP